MKKDTQGNGYVVIGVMAGWIALTILGSWTLFEVYNKRSDMQAIRRLGSFLPVAKVGKARVTYGQYLRSRDGLKVYLKSQGGEMTAEYENNIYERLLSQALTKQMAEEKGVAVTNDEVQKYFEESLAQTSSTKEEIVKYLKDNFNWTPEEYQELVFRPQMLEEKVAATFASSTDEAATKYQAAVAERLAGSDVKKYLNFGI